MSVGADLSAVDVHNAQTHFDNTAKNSVLFLALSQIGSGHNDLVDSDALSNLSKLNALADLPLLVESGNQTDNAALRDDLDNMSTWETTPRH